MIIIINGPSGSGKTTLGNYFEKLGLKRIVTSTTRPIREGEIEDVSYHFLSKTEFMSKERIEESLYSGNYYGVTKEEVDKNLSLCGVTFAVLDINGVNAFKKKYGSEVKVIHITASKTKVKDRMKKRGDSVKSIIDRIRFRNTTKEDENVSEADFIIYNNFDNKYLEKKGLEILQELDVLEKINNKN